MRVGIERLCRGGVAEPGLHGDLAVHDAYYARAIGRIRSFYLTIEPTGRQYWIQPAGDDPHAVMRQNGQQHSRWHHLSHTATSVAAVNGVLAAVLVGFTIHLLAPLPLPALAAAATPVAVGLFGGLLLDQERRWRQSDRAEPTRFLPDGTPAMTVQGFARSAPTFNLALARTADGQAGASARSDG